ncbi:MAG: AmmeMemoRadiSam system protein B [Pirellulales bacterium]|nr:AmmeMemoRadiSam system protein B [Pirellulales bacterium]
MNPSPSDQPGLNADEELQVFQAAGRRVAAVVRGRRPERFADAVAETGGKPLYGAFVSLKDHGRLRSCCGYLSPQATLAEAVSQAADRAAKDDPRFPPIAPDELGRLDMEVWLLWHPEEIAARGEDRVKEVTIGKHGLQVLRGGNRGLLLPGVATEHGFDARTFLQQTCIKAGLPLDAWLDDGTKVLRFEGYAIRGPFTKAFEQEVGHSCPTEETDKNVCPPGPETRPPAVAGMFYPGTAAEIQQALDVMFDQPPRPEPWAGALTPHAGWTYSGRLAAAVWSRLQIPPQVIIFSPRHRPGGAAWAVAPHRRWLFPGGELASDPELAFRLSEAVEGLELDAVAHRQEHAVEVQLPLVARLAPECRVVGITIGGGSLGDLQYFAMQIAGVLRPMNPRPLLVVSSDMNHFASDRENRLLDRIALDAVETLRPAHVYQTVQLHHISMCGLFGCVIVLETLRQLGALSRCELIGYATSAEAGGPRNRVVGYAGMVFA